MGHRDSQDHGWVSGSATIPDFGRVGRWVVTVAGRVIVPTRQKNATLGGCVPMWCVHPPRAAGAPGVRGSVARDRAECVATIVDTPTRTELVWRMNELLFHTGS